MQNWIKNNNTWRTSMMPVRTKSVDPSVVLKELFAVSGAADGSEAYVYSVCRNLNNVFSEYTRFYNQGLDIYDPHSFWIKTYFDKNTALKELNSITKYVKYSQDDTLEFISAFTKRPVDYLSSFIGTNFIIDSKTLNEGDTVLIRSQYTYNLSNYTFSRITPNMLRIEDPLGEIIQFFTNGNTARFTDADGNIVFEDTITNLKSVTILSVQYVQFETVNQIPENAINVADIIDGEYITDETNVSQHGIYTFNGTALVNNIENNYNDIIWIQDGILQFEKCYYKVYEIPNISTSIFPKYEACTPTIIGHRLIYDISTETYTYPDDPYKYVIMDYAMAQHIRASYSGLSENYITLNSDLETSVIYTFDKECDGIQNVLINEDDYRFGIDVPSLQFTQSNVIETKYISTIKQTFNTIDSTLDLNYPDGSGAIEFTVGDLVTIKVTDNNTNELLLNENLMVKNWDNTLKILEVNPPIPESVVSDINTRASYTVEINNISIFTDNQNLITNFNNSYLGKYYKMVINNIPSGINFYTVENNTFDVVDIADGDWVWVINGTDTFDPGIYQYDAGTLTYNLITNYGIDVYMKEGGRHYFNLEMSIQSSLNPDVKLKYPNPDLPYTFGYNITNILTQSDIGAPGTYDPSYEFSYMDNSLSAPYKNFDGTDRFGFSENIIILGTDYSSFYNEALLYVGLDINNGTDIINTSIRKIVIEGDYTYLYVDQYIPATFAPITGTTTTLTYRKTLGDFDNDILNNSIKKLPVEHYSKALLRDSNTQGFINTVIYNDNNGDLICALNEISGSSLDPRQTFEPIEVLYVKNDGIILDTIVVDATDWYIEDGKLIIVPNTNNNKKIRFIDGLKEELILTPGHYQNKYAWILDDNVIALNAIVGCTKDPVRGEGELVWYQGDWRAGTWEEGTWLSGTWRSGIWKGGTWKSIKIIDYGGENVIKVETDTKNEYSKFINGTWLDGTWFGGTFDGASAVWTTGIWYTGIFSKGIWKNGIWHNGTFDGTWNDGTWNGGQFLYGEWFAGNFNAVSSSRFGVSPTLLNKAIWYSGNFNGGEFHSGLNIVGVTPAESLDHRLSIWVSGNFNGGDWYGGTNIYCNFNSSTAVGKPSTWHGGLWLGGWRILSITDLGTFKRFEIDPDQYGDIININLTKHYITIAEKAYFTGRPVTNNDMTNNLFVNRLFNNANILPSGSIPTSAGKSITSVTNTTITCSDITDPLIGPPALTYPIEGPGTIDGRPMLASRFNGTFKKGIFKNGIFVNGSFEGGVFAGYFLKGFFGLEEL